MSKITSIMAIAAGHGTYVLHRNEVNFEPVAQLRRCLREMAFGLDRDDERQGELYRSMFSLISELQTSPVVFDDSFGAKIENLFEGGVADRTKWGPDIAANFVRAKAIAYDLMGELNPLVSEMVANIRMEVEGGKEIALSCSSRDKTLISHILAESGIAAEEVRLVCSESDYAQLSPVGSLYRLGPLLCWGRGVAPSAILSAPRFPLLHQFIWAGTSDDHDFGDDALNKFERSREQLNSPVAMWEISPKIIDVAWGKSLPDPVRVAGVVPSQDFEVFRRESGDLKTAILICIDERVGMLWPPASTVVAYDPSAAEDDQPVVMKAAGQLERGQYIAYVKQVGDNDEHSNQVTEERSALWKTALLSAIEKDAEGLRRALEQAGLRLRGLVQQLRYWTLPPSTVIHAPQSSEHFRILCAAIGLSDKSYPAKNGAREFWQVAWDDIRLSRGEAISAGVDRNDAFDRHLLNGLGTKLNGLPRDQVGNERIRIEIPSLREGEMLMVDLYLVQGIEDGFRAPSTALKVIKEIDYFRTQWH